MSTRYNDWDDRGYNRDYERYSRGYGYEPVDYYGRSNSGFFNEPDYGRHRFSPGYSDRFGDRYGDRYFGGGYGSRAGGYGSYGGYGYGERDDYYGSSPNRQPYRGGRENRDWLDRAGDEVASWFGDEEAERRRRMDEMRQGHRGRGPKGYQRSDDRIREDVSDRLWDNTQIDASDVEVKVKDGVVQLEGTVDSRWAKRRIEDIAEDVTGVSDVENRIRIDRTSTSEMTSETKNKGSATSAKSGR